MPVSGYRDLEVWKKAMDLVVKCYRQTKSFLNYERFGLNSRFQRAVVFIPCSVAEGHARTGLREYLHHLSIAYGSLMEVETQIQMAQRLEYETSTMAEDLLADTQQLGRMLNSLKRALQNKFRE